MSEKNRGKCEWKICILDLDPKSTVCIGYGYKIDL